MTRKPWKEIRASASPEVLESAAAVVTRRVQIERELRRRLEQHVTPFPVRGGKPMPVRLLNAEVDSLTAALAPWLLELVEQVEGETREDCGMLP